MLSTSHAISTRSAYVDAPNRAVDVAGRTLAYRSIGTGTPSCSCTRFRGNMDKWDPAFIDALANSGFRVITFDYSGLGLSTGRATYNPIEMAADFRDLIAGLNLQRRGDRRLVARCGSRRAGRPWRSIRRTFAPRF